MLNNLAITAKFWKFTVINFRTFGTEKRSFWHCTRNSPSQHFTSQWRYLKQKLQYFRL